MRVYLPYGQEWYPYLVRRLAERPANIGFFVRALLNEALAGATATPEGVLLGYALALGFEELAFAAALLDQPLRRPTAARALVEPVVFLVAAGDHL